MRPGCRPVAAILACTPRERCDVAPRTHHVIHQYDVVVIGAGPAGSYAASLLAVSGHRVLILDQRSEDALSPRCTGVVGRPYVELLGLDDDVVLAQAKSATLFSPGGERLRVESRDVQAYILDRVLLEWQLRRRAVAAGADVIDGFVATTLASMERGWEVSGVRKGRREKFSCRALVLAAGVCPALARQAGVSTPLRYLVGAHVEVDMSGVDETEVHFLSDVAPGSFAWLVPVSAGRVRLGALCDRSAAAVLRRFLVRPDISRRLAHPPGAIAQRPVPVSMSPRAHARAVVSIGDAAGQVKPTTGGGLYYGALGARFAAEVVGDALCDGDLSEKALGRYDRLCRSRLGSEMRRGALARVAYTRLSPGWVDRLVAQAQRTGLAETLLASHSFSFDHHGGTLLSGLLRSLPGALVHGDTSARGESR